MAKRKKKAVDGPVTAPAAGSPRAEDVRADQELPNESRVERRAIRERPPAKRRKNAVPKPGDPVKAVPNASDETLGQAELELRNEMRHVEKVVTVVQVKESHDNVWKEITEVTTVSRNGAALVLSRPCTVGRIVSLVMQMPVSLRVYGHFDAMYPMLAVVQNCSKSDADETTVYHVGVAFIGRRIPPGYKEDPSTTYRIIGVNSEGLWAVAETPKKFKVRKDPRFWRRFEVSVSARDEVKRVVQREKLFTRDVSRAGVAVWGPLAANIGDRLKVVCAEMDFFSMATVRNRTDHPTDDTRSLIHLEFDPGSGFPVERLTAETTSPAEAEPEVTSREMVKA